MRGNHFYGLVASSSYCQQTQHRVEYSFHMILLEMSVLVAILLAALLPSGIAAVGCDSDTPCQRAPLPSALLSQWRPANSEAEVILRLRCRIACEEEASMQREKDLLINNVEEANVCDADCFEQSGIAAGGNCTTLGCRVYCKYIQDSPIIESASTDSILEVSPSMKTTALVAEYTIHIPTPNLTLWNNSDIVYLLKVVDLDEENTSSLYYQRAGTRDVSLSLLQFACSRISISFAAVSKQRAVGFSTPTEICVNDGLPGPPEGLSASVVGEDLRPEFLGHAILNVSWNKPQNGFEGVQYYSLLFELSKEQSIKMEDNCRNLTIINRTMIVKENTSYLLNATDEEVTSLPAFECHYNITIKSHPGSGETLLGNFQIAYKEQSWLNIECEAHFNESTVTYDLIAKWKIPITYILSAELIISSIREYKVQRIQKTNPVLPEYMIDRIENERLQHIFYNNLPLTIGQYEITVKPLLDSTFPWRKPVTVKGDRCTLLARPRKPSPVENITAVNVAAFESNRSVQFHLFWIFPKYPFGEILQFELSISNLEIPPSAESVENADTLRRTIIGTQNELYFEDPVPFAFGTNGFNTIYVQMRSMNEFELTSNWSKPLTLNISLTATGQKFPVFVYPLAGVVGGLLLLIALVFIGIMCYFCCLRHRIKEGPDRNPTVNLNDRHPVEQNPSWSRFTDRWELLPDEIIISESEHLGTGCFGVVYKGVVRQRSVNGHPFQRNQPSRFNPIRTVAIKKMKEYAIESEKASFLKEIDMMKKVSGTENELSQFVVNMVGCVTEREPLLLVLEYVKYSDLLTYLKSIRKQTQTVYFNIEREVGDNDPIPYMEPQGVYSELAPDLFNEKYAELGILEQKDLLEFARQAAAGMEFLSDLEIVHRDLACRNILIGGKKHIKISDFGMSRYVPGEEVYVITSKGLLPLRWMATESLFYQQFTSASDVWSYGITLWEICTLGGFPYCTLSNKDLTQELKRGYRLDKPPNTSDEIYDVMIKCWNADPELRPKFSELRIIFDKFRQVHTEEKYPYIELTVYHAQDRPTHTTNTNDNEVLQLDLDAETGTGSHTMQLLTPPENNRLSTTSLHSRKSAVVDSEIESLASIINDDEPDARYVQSPVGTSCSSVATQPDFSSDVESNSETRLPFLDQVDVHCGKYLTIHSCSRVRPLSASPPLQPRSTVTRSLPDIADRTRT